MATYSKTKYNHQKRRRNWPTYPKRHITPTTPCPHQLTTWTHHNTGPNPTQFVSIPRRVGCKTTGLHDRHRNGRLTWK